MAAEEFREATTQIEITRDYENAVLGLIASGGIAIMELEKSSETLHKIGFETARQAFTHISSCTDKSNTVHLVPEGASASHVTGYHSASSSNSLSRYNKHREGFIFSDGASLSVDGIDNFAQTMDSFYQSLHGVASKMLLAIEWNLNLPEGWFESNLGPSSTASQWHVKRYVEHPNNGLNEVSASKQSDADDDMLLPMHTDPSLVSIVVLDAEGRNDSALGLQYNSNEKAASGRRKWTDVPGHGHGIAVVFAGSLMQHITGGYIQAMKHRVVRTGRGDRRERLAATLFLRPQGTALLQVPPSPILRDVTLKSDVSFENWLARVSKNYKKAKKKGSTTLLPIVDTSQQNK